jgi:hypothetical protein
MVETEAALPGTVHEAAALDDHVPPLVVRRSQNSIISCCHGGCVADPGCLSRIPDPTFFHPGSRIRTFSIPDPGSSSKNLSILTPKKPKKLFLSSKKYDLGCSSRIPDPDADFLPIPDPGSRGQKGTRSRIRIRNTAWRVRLSLVILATPAGT